MAKKKKQYKGKPDYVGCRPLERVGWGGGGEFTVWGEKEEEEVMTDQKDRRRTVNKTTAIMPSCVNGLDSTELR